MGVSILITDSKFYSEFINDVGFGSNLTEYTNNLAGSVMENVKLVQQVDIGWSYTVSESDSMGIEEISPTQMRFDRSNPNWANDGFAVGDDIQINWTDASGSQSQSGEIVSLSGSVIIVEWAGLPIPGDINGWINNSTVFYGTTDLTSSVYKFGLIDNNANFSITSLVSNNDQGYYGAGIGFDTGGGVRDTNFVELQRLGSYEDWRTGSARIRYVENPSTYVQRFEIEHEFTIVPYYLDGELSNLQDNATPCA